MISFQLSQFFFVILLSLPQLDQNCLKEIQLGFSFKGMLIRAEEIKLREEVVDHLGLMFFFIF